MNSRERILATLNHHQPDRCVTDTLFIHPLVWRQLAKHVGIRAERKAERSIDLFSDIPERDEVERALKIDRWRRVFIRYGRAADHDDRLRRFVPDWAIDAKGVQVLKDGRVIQEHPDISYLEHVLWHPLQDVEKVPELADYPFPAPDLLGPVADAFRHQVGQLKASDAVVTGSGPHPFKTACELRGTQNFLCDLLLNPPLANALYDRLYAALTAQCVAYAQAGVDVVQIIGDIAMQDRLITSPETWRRYDKPRLAHLIREIKSVHTEVKLFMHTDGNVMDIIPDLIEVGLDILNSIQPESMDPVALKHRWGDQIVLHGGVSLQHTVPHGAVQDVKREVRYLVEHCEPGGGFVLAPSNALLPEFPVENVAAMYEALF